MKKILVFACAALMLLCAAGCKNYTQQVLPQHATLKKSATVPEDANGLTSAYIRATDAAINAVTDNKRGEAPEYISFDFGTGFALKQAERDVLVAAFSVYQIPTDADGLLVHNTLQEHNRGYVIQYIVGQQHNKGDTDLTITIEIWYGNKGYAYYCDFNIKNDEYVFVAFEAGYENIHATA